MYLASGDSLLSYFTGGDGGETVTEGPTFPSKDFVRIWQSQWREAESLFGRDGFTIGLSPENTSKIYPNTPLSYAKAVYVYWQQALIEAEKKWGKGAFPQATAAMEAAYNALSESRATRTLPGTLAHLGKQLGPIDTKAFWDGTSRTQIQLASKEFAVPYAMPKQWIEYVDNAKKMTIQALSFAKNLVPDVSKPLVSLANIVRWSVIGGIALGVWYYAVRPAYAAYQAKHPR